MLRGSGVTRRRAIGIGALIVAAACSASLAARQTPSRIDNALKESRERYTEWLGPPRQPIEPVHDVRVGWLVAPASMDVESQVAYETARQWFGPASTSSVTMVNGVAWYLQSRVVERLFDFAFATEGCCLESTSFFGGHVPWGFSRLPLSRWSAGLGRTLPPGRRLPPSVDAATIRAALAFGTLEKYLTWPVLQSALREWRTQASAKALTAADVQQIISNASGEDLEWFFSQAFDPARRFDYGIETFTTEGKTTRVTVVRRGAAMFTGRTRSPEGPYESGDAMELRVTFADGQQVTERWDGRQASRVFEFESGSPAVEACLDPNQVLLLDENYLDNRRMKTPSHNIAVAKWTARWVMWLQNAALTYGTLF
jgi:hypothetical protein